MFSWPGLKVMESSLHGAEVGMELTHVLMGKRPAGLLQLPGRARANCCDDSICWVPPRVKGPEAKLPSGCTVGWEYGGKREKRGE